MSYVILFVFSNKNFLMLAKQRVVVACGLHVTPLLLVAI